MRPLRLDAAATLRIPLEDVLDTLVVKQARAAKFRLAPFFFPIAARTITALTVMRSGRKLRHLGIVGSQPKTKANTKHKPNTQKPNKNQTTPNQRSPQKGEKQGATV